MSALSRRHLRHIAWRCCTLLVLAGLLLAPAGPVVQTVYADSHPVTLQQPIKPGPATGTATRTVPSAAPNAAPQQEGSPMSKPETQSGNSNGLTLLLSEGSQQPQAVSTPAPAEAQPLSDADTQALLSRTQVISPTEPLTQAFQLPPKSLPPPQVGATIEQSFPPTATTATTATAPVSATLTVLRYAPTGEIPVAPFLNVTFSQPMVPLGTLAELAAADVPVKITPEVSGVWKWLGTTTLSFEYRGKDLNRFPMATEYKVEIPAGTKSATGGVLEQAVTWTFSTPTVTMHTAWPTQGPQPRNPLLFVSFNQAIDPAAVLKTITASAGGQNFALRLATPEEVAADEQVSAYVKSAGEKRWIAFRSEQEFPGDTTVTIDIGPGTPSAEGPLTTKQVQSFSFQTYGPLRITDSYCGYKNSPCPPGMPFSVQFNNPLDPKSVSNESVAVTPTIPGMMVSAGWNQLTIQGATAGRTTYTVIVKGTVKDQFGQSLGQDAKLSFTTGNASAFLTGPQGALTTLDPTSKTPVFTVYSINYDKLRVRAWQVTPEQWPDYLTYMQNFYRDKSKTPPGKEVLNTTVDVKMQPDVLTETSIDLSPALGGKPGQLIVMVDKPASLLSMFTGGNDYVVTSWVQATNIGLDAISDGTSMTAWATQLTDGKPLEGVNLQLLPGTATAVSGADGLAKFELSPQVATLLVGRQGDDTAILPRAAYPWDSSGWTLAKPTDELRWYVFDDRGMYKPGEEVHVKGYLRKLTAGPTGDISMQDIAGSPITYRVLDPQGNQLTEGTLKASDLGGFSMAFTVPVNSNLGYASIQFSAQNVGMVQNADFYHNFQIQDFRRPEFEVTARNETTAPYLLGGDAVVAVSAQYYAGGPLPNANTQWSVSASPSSYSPPNWPEFTFGEWTPWWLSDSPVRGFGMVTDIMPPYSGGGGMSQPLVYAATTDATGNQYLKMTFVKAEKPQPYSVQAEARVMDVNNQAWSATTTLLVHPSELYVGLKSNSTFVQQGDPIDVNLIVTDIDGKAVAGRQVKARAVRMAWEFVDGQWKQKEADEQICTVESKAEPVACSFKTSEGGEYQISAEVRDDAERLNRSMFTRWVSGGQVVPSRNVEMEQVVLVPDRENYQGGDTAKILVQAPFSAASGLLTVSRSGILYTQPFTMTNGSTTLEIPIKEEYLPNIHVQVDVNGSAPRLDDKGKPVEGAPPRPAYGSGSLDLNIPPLTRTLTMTLTPAATKLEPGANTSLALELKDAAGKPVPNAEVAVVVVDEAILALTNYTLDDPVTAFYTLRGSGTDTIYGRSSIVLANPQELAQEAQAATANRVADGVGGGATAAAAAPAAAPAPGAPAATAAPQMMESAARAPSQDKVANQPTTPIGVRTDFNPLAVFAPDVHTDAQGKATVNYKLPDNLTRYRVMVVAATEKDFGSAETNITARLPLMVRPSAPRFLNFGDRFALPVVLQNQTDTPLNVDVAVQSANLKLDGPAGQRVTVPANDRVAVNFPASTENVGTAYAQIAAASGTYADAAQVKMPVYTPATTEAFATYGTVDQGSVAQPLSPPKDVFPQFGGLQVSTSSTALQNLTDAVLYLQDYPFECSEQIASRVMSVASLRDVLSAFKAKGLPPPAEINAAMLRDIDRLQQMQNADGGWPIWAKGDDSVPYYSVFAAHALQVAVSKDYKVAPETLQAAREYLRNIEAHYESWYSPEVKQTLSAYALYVRWLMGDVDPAKAREVYAQLPLDKAPLEALAWLWQVMGQDAGSAQETAEIARRINNSAVETAGMANFYSGYGDQNYVMLHSDRRTDAIILDALISEQPDSDLITKVVRGLMAARVNGRWNNTQENVFVILAMDRYFNTFEKVTPDFIARVWLGDQYVAENQFKGYTTDTYETNVPMEYLMQQPDPTNVIVSKDGDGRLYYRLGLQYAPTSLKLDPLDMGFVVERTYEAVDDPADVRRDDQGVWHIREGARVRIKLTMVATNRRYHVALVDRLPAGLEIINPDLAVSESIPSDPSDTTQNYGWWWWGPWYEHQNLRDAGAEAFTTYLWDGVYNYSYVARATVPGEYVVPPARAEEMYSPEVFGRTGSEKVIVEAK